jgi:hypothetical protein
MNYTVLTKKFIFLLVMLSLSSAMIAQVKFEKGYFIGKDGQRTECLVLYTDSRNTPHSFSYKMAEADKTGTLNARDVKEVGINGYAKFISAVVEIDKSIDDARNIDELSRKREPEFKTEELFLKVVVDGQSGILYSYYEQIFVRFFYSTVNSPITQLVYKTYRTSETGYEFNRDYLNQLNAYVTCDASQKISQPDYRETDLKKYFISFNACKGSPVTTIASQVKLKRFSVSLLAGVERSSLQAENYEVAYITRFDSKINPFAGLELEYILPFDRNKLSILLDVFNDSYSSAGKDSAGTAQVTYGSIAAAIGPRYRFFLNDNSSIFISAMPVFEFRTKGNYHWVPNTSYYYYPEYLLEVKTSAPVLAIAAGYAYKNFSAEFRYLTTKELFPGDSNAGSHFKRMALMVKYRIFKF